MFTALVALDWLSFCLWSEPHRHCHCCKYISTGGRRQRAGVQLFGLYLDSDLGANFLEILRPTTPFILPWQKHLAYLLNRCKAHSPASDLTNERVIEHQGPIVSRYFLFIETPGMHESISGKHRAFPRVSSEATRFLIAAQSFFLFIYTTIFYTAGHTKHVNINRWIVLCFNVALGCRHTVEMTDEPWMHEYTLHL